jgi:ribonuclease HI
MRNGSQRRESSGRRAGAVLVERSQDGWTVVWWDMHYMGDDSTNNAAEHEALRRGIQECAGRYRDRHAHITVIGDSQLVLRQASGSARTRNKRLQHTLQRTQRALRDLATFDFLHTLRAGNKMADLLANVAMDERTTRSGPNGTDHTTCALYDLLHNDINHHTTPTHNQHDILTHLRQQLSLERQRHQPASRKRPADNQRNEPHKPRATTTQSPA